jgi:hypothetical protein
MKLNTYQEDFTMRTAAILLALIGALALVVGCGDDTEKPVVKLDTGVNQETGVQPDTGPVKYDGQGPTPDQSIGPIVNSGDVCSQSSPCKSKSESCMALETGGTSGMCLGKCNAAQTDCPVADKATQLSKCLLQDQKKQLHCAWMCDVQGKKYKCPNDTDYKCIALNASQPDVKYCAPKGGSTTVDGGVPQG